MELRFFDHCRHDNGDLNHSATQLSPSHLVFALRQFMVHNHMFELELLIKVPEKRHVRMKQSFVSNLPLRLNLQQLTEPS